MNVTVPVLDREYSIRCSPASKDELYKSVAELQSICDRIKKNNPGASIDKILVTAAVNLAAQSLVARTDMEVLNKQIAILTAKVDLID